MKKFMLVEVLEYNISKPIIFDSYDEAYKHMKECYDKANVVILI